MSDNDPSLKANVYERGDFLEIAFERDNWIEDRDGRVYMQKDYRVNGTIWQVHKTDADPFPSWPHAHCVGGQRRYIGMKLHLGTAELFDGARPAGFRLKEKQFLKLVELIQPKFPHIKLPLEI